MPSVEVREFCSPCLAPPRPIFFNKDRSIYIEGEPARCWFEVVKGVVRTCRFHLDGRRQLTGFYHPLDSFGVEPGFYADTAEAVTDVIVIPHPNSSEASIDGRYISADHEEALNRALRNAKSCIHYMGRKTAEEKVAAFLVGTYDRSGGGYELDLAMSRADIADLLGLTIHTVSRTLSDIARKGLISFQGRQHIRITNPYRLRVLAGIEAPPANKPDGHRQARPLETAC